VRRADTAREMQTTLAPSMMRKVGVAAVPVQALCDPLRPAARDLLRPAACWAKSLTPPWGNGIREVRAQLQTAAQDHSSCMRRPPLCIWLTYSAAAAALMLPCAAMAPCSALTTSRPIAVPPQM